MRYPILQRGRAIIVQYPIKTTRKTFAILSLQLSHNMRSIAAGPVRVSCLVHTHRAKRSFKSKRLRRTPISCVIRLLSSFVIGVAIIDAGIVI